MKKRVATAGLPRVLALGALLVSGPIMAQPVADVQATSPLVNEQMVMATLWMQRSAEYRALSYQAFNIARLRLDQALASHGEQDKPLAVVVDCDETVINNMAFDAYLIQQGVSYDQALWNRWEEAAQASAMPGAHDFLRYAQAKGVEVFYITNREAEGRARTLANLEKLDFPYVDREHVLLKTTSSNKDARRERVRKDFDIALLMGDNLGDFDGRYDVDDTEARSALVEAQRDKFGDKFIVLPNPVYGKWESALHGSDAPASEAETAARRKQRLAPWQPAGK